MKTPEEKYRNDPEYHLMVDTMVELIIQCRFTPSEMREMATFASILYERRYAKPSPLTSELIKQNVKANNESKIF